MSARVMTVPARSGSVIVHPVGCDCLEVERASVAAFIEEARSVAEAGTVDGGDRLRTEDCPMCSGRGIVGFSRCPACEGVSEYARAVRAARQAEAVMRAAVGR